MAGWRRRNSRCTYQPKRNFKLLLTQILSRRLNSGKAIVSWKVTSCYDLLRFMPSSFDLLPFFISSCRQTSAGVLPLFVLSFIALQLILFLYLFKFLLLCMLTTIKKLYIVKIFFQVLKACNYILKICLSEKKKIFYFFYINNNTLLGYYLKIIYIF